MIYAERLRSASRNAGPFGTNSSGAIRSFEPTHAVFRIKLEAPPGFEPGIEVLQTSALPLGDGADWIVPGILLPAGAGGKERSWSGKRDSNPRLRPWQGRTLPLSYSRSPGNPERTTAIFHQSRSDDAMISPR